MASTSEMSLDTRKLLLALFVDVTQDRNFKPCFKAAHRELHQFFWRLKQDKRFKPFVQDLLFDTNGNYPHCEQIDELLQEFQLSGVLSRPNPTYKYNDIAIRANPTAEEFRRGLSGQQAGEYQGILDQFKEDLGVRAKQSTV